MTRRAKRVAAPLGVPTYEAAMFEHFTLKAADTVDKYSGWAIANQIRWHEWIERGNKEFRFNNNWIADLTRWMMAKYPSLRGFFEIRERKAGDDAPAL